jgi:putative transposase
MDTDQELRRGRHCVFAMHVHLIFVTKYRRKIFDGDALERLSAHFSRVAMDFGATVVECSGERNHVHLLVEYPPKVSISSLVRSMKGVSSRMLRQERPDIVQHYWKEMLWSPSYFAASCGGAPLSIIRQYVEQQNRPP